MTTTIGWLRYLLFVFIVFFVLIVSAVGAFGRQTSALEPGEVLVRVETSFGNIDLAIDTKRAPITAANFLKYVDGGFYTAGQFHRATRPDNYVPKPRIGRRSKSFRRTSTLSA
jgi:peptidyl-prolyl cis-trans isomerase A (cyclophilin A)